MKIEIERKFLVANEGWRAGVTSASRLRDGLVGSFESRKVRVRIDDERSWITVKGPRIGLGRAEFEFEVPRGEAEQMLREVCVGCAIEKVRHFVPHGGLIWEVDVYERELAGIVMAEVELEREDQELERPDWLCREVTWDARFRLSTLLAICSQPGRTLSVADVLERSL
jgi:CYTH domain-containing protein